MIVEEIVRMPEYASLIADYKAGSLFRGTDGELKAALAAGTLEFREGTLGGVSPRIIG